MYLEVPQEQQEQQARLTLEDVVVIRARLLTCSFLGWWSYMTTSIHYDSLRSTTNAFVPCWTGGEQSVHRDGFHVVESNAVLLAGQRDGQE